ncbi:hypothetical protein OJAV_G00180000 [Oryzias javanicus]|uniref:Uncharacterized protein n=1 Tax=Oryzias javanicus TaxID=123683 RepID=A0A437CC60_ORYJA|nr:hypothetical protein OJAV_G00180000 [Oryzias javanicus]
MHPHPGPYTLPRHTTDNSDLPIQWALLSRPNSSTDRGSSLGSIESLDTPTLPPQSYSNSLTPPLTPPYSATNGTLPIAPSLPAQTCLTMPLYR